MGIELFCSLLRDEADSRHPDRRFYKSNVGDFNAWIIKHVFETDHHITDPTGNSTYLGAFYFGNKRPDFLFGRASSRRFQCLRIWRSVYSRNTFQYFQLCPQFAVSRGLVADVNYEKILVLFARSIYKKEG